MALIKHLREYQQIVFTFENKVTITMAYIIVDHCYFKIITYIRLGSTIFNIYGGR
jgi:hypothetical protein